MTIKKPDLDNRIYENITLRNDLQAILISDPEAQKAACALDVHVGHLLDPQVHGLAHFCEHLLFMGTEKFPIENEYSQFLSSHGGSSNAFTSGSNTNYYFDINSDFLTGALDRFAQFFISPLFLEDCTDRELKAVDSEHKKNIHSDNWRIHQLEKDTSNPNHPFNNFGTGNIETLRDIPLRDGLDIRKILLDFHERYYSANIMKLVVIGKESIEELKQIVTNLFSPVVNKKTVIPTFAGSPLTPNELQKVIYVRPVKQTKIIKLIFPFPDDFLHFRTHPCGYASHLIGHEGAGSILSFLKKSGLANNLSAGASGSTGTGFDFFRITIELTTLGLEQYQSVVTYVFEYIKMIQSYDTLEWVFHESLAINSLDFRFKEKQHPASYCSNVAGNMHLFPAEHVLSGPYLADLFDPVLIKESLNLLRPDNFRLY